MKEFHTRQRENKNGNVWEYWFEISTVAGTRKRISKSGFKTKTEAHNAGFTAYNEYHNGGRYMETEISFSDFLKVWLQEYVMTNTLPTTQQNYEKMIRNYINPVLGKYQLQKLSNNVIQQFINDLIYKKKISRNSVVGIKAILTSVFKYAIENYRYIRVNDNPMLSVKIPKKRVTDRVSNKHENVVISPEDMKTIFDRFGEGSTAYIPMQIAYRCGLRRGEVFGLTWDNIDFENKQLIVNKQLQYDTRSKEWCLVRPKYDSFRTIGIDDTLYDILKLEKEKQEKDEKNNSEYLKIYENDSRHINSTGIKRIGEKEVFFVNRRSDGSFVSSGIMQYASNIIHTKLNIKTFTFHSLRHTHCTNLLASGAAITYVQHRMGHKSIQETLNTYYHYIQKIGDEGDKLLGAVNAGIE